MFVKVSFCDENDSEVGVYRWSDGRKFEGQWAHNRTAICYRVSRCENMWVSYNRKVRQVRYHFQSSLSLRLSFGYLFFLRKTSTRLEKE